MTYRILRLRQHLRQPFRYAPHVSGTATVKPNDYEPVGEVEAHTPYAAFFALKDTEMSLQLGDLLERDGELRIFKFVGFEEAQWREPDLRKGPVSEAPPDAASGQGSAARQ